MAKPRPTNPVPEKGPIVVSGKFDPNKIERGHQPRLGTRIFKDERREAEIKAGKNIKRGKYDEVAPPGWEGTVKAMKKHKDIDNPWALAWSMKKKGYKSHKKKKHESNNGYPTFSEWLNARDH